MGFYVTLTLATLVIATLTIRIWRKTHSVAFVVGTVFMYYWSLYGAWTVVWSGGELDNYLIHKMFPVNLDGDYFLALVLYTLFVVVIQLTVLWRAKPVKAKVLAAPLFISHYKILVASGISALLGYLLVRDSISIGVSLAGSGYGTIRNAPFFTLYQILLNFSMLPLSISLAVFFCGKDAKYLAGKSTLLGFFGYAVILGVQLLFCILVGNRSEVMVCFVAMGLFYLSNAKQPRQTLVAVLGVIAVATLTAVKMWRDRTFLEIGTGGLGAVFTEFSQNFAGGTESLSAHFSMYGVLHKHVPLTGGLSFVSLICSLIPRAFWPDRPDPIYFYYVRSVGAVEGQGYTIHHGTAWYLNFGTAGVLLGAFLLGLLWVELYNRFERSWYHQGVSRLYSIIGFWIFTAAIPAVLRDGPETYKAIVIDFSLVPLTMLVFASSTLVLRQSRPSLVLARSLRPARQAISANR